MTQRKKQAACEVLIVGGGINGLSLAKALGDRQIHVTLIDREDPRHILSPEFSDVRTTAVSQGMKKILAVLNIWPELEPHAQPILTIDIRDGESATPLFFNATDVGNLPLGYIVENTFIRRALWRAVLNHPHIVVMPPDRAAALDVGMERATLVTDKGQTISARLVIGADGRQSFIRKAARIPQKTWSYKQTAQVFFIRHTRPHNATAWEKFLPQGPLAILPMRGNAAQVVWSVASERAAHLATLDNAAFAEEFLDHFGDDLGAVEIFHTRALFPLSFNHAHRYTAPRVALVGDAAHGLHPIAGQGLNLGMRDVAALTDIVHTARSAGDDIGSATVLTRYHRQRRPDVLALILMTDGINRLFAQTSPLITVPRRLGLQAVARSSALRTFFAEYAMGTGDHFPELKTHHAA